MNLWYDEKRQIKFESGTRVHWFEYARDMIIMNGGFGTLVDFETAGNDLNGKPTIFFNILCDDGSMRVIISHDVDIEEPWED